MNQPKPCHDFEFSIMINELVTASWWWPKVMEAAFPNYIKMELVESGKNDLQFAGVDRIIYHPERQVLIDDKSVWWPRDNYCIEYISNDQTKTKGWVEKEASTDLIAYCNIYNAQVRFLSFRRLQVAWFANKQRWFEEASRDTGQKPEDKPVRFYNADNIDKRTGSHYHSHNLLIKYPVLDNLGCCWKIIDFRQHCKDDWEDRVKAVMKMLEEKQRNAREKEKVPEDRLL